LTNKNLPLILGAIGALAGVIAAIKYFEDKDHRETIARVSKLEEEIKREQLRKIKTGLWKIL